MNHRTRTLALILLSLSGAPAHARGAADAGPMIAEQGNAALQSIRNELTRDLGAQLREQIDLCNLAVRPRGQLASATTAGRIEVATQADDVPAPHCASRREV
jgi:hypothetical protein